MSTLIQHVIEKSPAVVDEAREAGPEAAASLFPLLNHGDWEVRELAVYCLDATGASGVASAFAARLADASSQVRAAALEGLRHRAGTDDRDALLRAWDAASDGATRREIALLVGRVSDPAALPELARRCEAEASPEAIEGCTVARARLGDETARGEYLARLARSAGRAREPWITDGWYLRAPWLLPGLLPALDDRADVRFVGLDGRPELTQNLRACDLAVNLVAAISGRRFGFEVRGDEHPTNYSDANIDEVRRYLRGIASSP